MTLEKALSLIKLYAEEGALRFSEYSKYKEAFQVILNYIQTKTN